MMTRQEKAVKYFRDGFHCSQAVFASYAEECGFSEEQALKLGACFGGGMRKGEVCGACSGALMVLGMLYGQYDMNDPESRMTANKVNDEMMKRFREKNGTYICNDLLGCDISTQQGAQYALENKLFIEFCPKMVESAIEILEEIIKEN